MQVRTEPLVATAAAVGAAATAAVVTVTVFGIPPFAGVEVSPFVIDYIGKLKLGSNIH